MPADTSFNLNTWGEVLFSSFSDMWQGVIAFVPKLLVAIIIFILGWVLGAVLGRWVAQFIQALRIDQALRGVGVESVVTKAGFRLDSGAFLGALVKWFFIVVFLVASLQVIGLTQVNQFLQEIVLRYLPQVIIAVFILLIAAVVADVLEKIVVGSAKAADMPSAHLLGTLTRWSVWVFALLVALSQLGIGVIYFQTLFTGVVAMLALAGGLAFGLGGRDVAARYIEKRTEEMRNRHHS